MVTYLCAKFAVKTHRKCLFRHNRRTQRFKYEMIKNSIRTVSPCQTKMKLSMILSDYNKKTNQTNKISL